MDIVAMWGICSLEMGCHVVTLNKNRMVRFMLGLFGECYSIWAIDEVLVSKNIAEGM